MIAAVEEDARRPSSLGGQHVGSDAVPDSGKRWMPHVTLQETGGARSSEERGRGRSKSRSGHMTHHPEGSPGPTSDLVAKTSEAENDWVDIEWENDCHDGGAWDAYCNKVMEARAREALSAKTHVITDC
jgi:hypothetical protein